MKSSIFNTIVDINEGEKLLYNSYKSSLVKLDKNAYEAYQKIISPDEIDVSDPLIFASVADFKRGGFIVDNDFNEVDYIKVIDTIGKFSHNKQLSLTIAPTEECNFNCTYCYENIKPHKYLNKKNEEKIIDYVKNRLEPEGSLSITWFGGEPLMAPDIIYRLSEEFMKIADAKKSYYSASIVTNGYLLSRSVVENFKKYKITMIQVTVDGAPEYHDSVRQLKNGRGTFDRILCNIRDAKDIYRELVVLIRVNVGKGNINSFPEFVDKLEEYNIKDKIMLSISELEPHDYLSKEVNDAVLTPKEFSKAYAKMVDMAVERKIAVIVMPTNMSHCSSTSLRGLLVGSDGKLYKCWDVIGNHSECVGEIGEDIKPEASLKWLAWDVLNNEKCRSCSILPLCMGGCPRKSLVEDKIVNSMDHCSHIKYVLPELVKIMYKQRMLMRKIG